MLISTIRTITRRPIGRLLSSSLARTKEVPIEAKQEQQLKEQCFLVDMSDNIIGTASKRDCHRVQKDGTVLLHRAFSVFLFNSKGDLLLQKRASEKVTYPDHYTNSCCSHPIADVPGEDEAKDALGIKRAALRRLNYELGIPLNSIPIDNVFYLTRIHYMDEGNGVWGEHEIDYILFIKQDVQIHPNPSEISEISFVPLAEFDSFIPTLGASLTPWFSLISKHRLKLWWQNLDDLEDYKDHSKILQLKKD